MLFLSIKTRFVLVHDTIHRKQHKLLLEVQVIFVLYYSEIFYFYPGSKNVRTIKSSNSIVWRKTRK